jgi:hypothetical protein
LKKIHRILKPAGRLFIKIQEGDSAEISCPDHLDASLMMDLNIMSSGEITGLINESGFGVIRTFLDKKDPSDNFAHLNELCLMVQKNESEAA